MLVVLAWQGEHLAHLLPRFEQAIQNLGPWGPIAFIAAVLVFEPLLVPDTLFAITAGVAFGPVEGTLYYVVAVYAVCLIAHGLGARWLKGPVLRQLAAQPRIRTLVEKAATGGVRPTLFVRLVPVNQTLVSYALGAMGVPLRSAWAGNLAMFTHMLPSVWFGAAAVHMTRMAGTHHTAWERDGILGMLALGICAVLAMHVSDRARREIITAV